MTFAIRVVGSSTFGLDADQLLLLFIFHREIKIEEITSYMTQHRDTDRKVQLSRNNRLIGFFWCISRGMIHYNTTNNISNTKQHYTLMHCESVRLDDQYIKHQQHCVIIG